MAGFENDIVFSKNADFSDADNQAPAEANGLVTDGQLWVGTTATNAGGTHINVGKITSPDLSVVVGYSSPNITLTSAGASPTTFDADTGSANPVLNTIQLLGGSNGIDTTAAGNTVTFNFDLTEQPTIATSYATPSGTAIPAANILNLANGTGVSITGAGNTVTVNASATTPLLFNADSGSATPAANAITLAGSGSITTSGAGSTITTQLTGLTNHSVLLGAGTSTITKLGPTATAGQVLQSAGVAADPAFSTATYPSTTTVSEILYSSATNVVSGLATGNRGVLTTGVTGIPVITPLATDGQVLIGSTAGVPTAATLTPSTGISITNGSNSITIASTATTPLSFPTDSGTATPAANALTLAGSGSIATSGSGATVTTSLTGLTNHSVLVGAGTSTITKLGVGTNGQVLIGATAADPAFSSLTSSDSSITFTPGANSLSLQVAGGTSVGKTITGDTGGALSPTAGNWNLLGSGSITTTGAGSTLTTQLTGLTNHNVLIGAGTTTITKVAPSATSGVPLVSQGAAADPIFGTASVAGGGTGATTLTGVLTGNGTSAVTASTVTNHGVVVGGASNAVSSTAVGSTGQVLQGNTGADPTYSTATYPSTTTINQVLYSSANNTVGGITAANNGTLISGTTGVPSWLANGTTGQVLTATTGSPPSWAAASTGSAFTQIVVQFFGLGTTTYTPTSGMKYCIIEVIGGGGGGGGANTTGAGQVSCGGGGGGGGYARGVFTAAEIGASISVTGGAAGTAGANTGGTGGTGGTSIAGALLSAAGGVGGVGGGTAAVVSTTLGGAGGVGSPGTGDFASVGTSGTNGAGSFAAGFAKAGTGGSSYLGAGGVGACVNTGRAAGSNGSNYGGGGGGAAVMASQTGFTGGVGGSGCVIVTEFI